MLSKDEEIIALDCSCFIHSPAEDGKQEIHTNIRKCFENYIAIFLIEIDQRILHNFDGTETVYKEMEILDPRFAEKAFTDDENEVCLKKLCKLNKISNEITAINELKIFTSEYLQYQNRPKFEAIFKNNLFDLNEPLDNYDEELISFLFEDGSDIEETTANIRDVDFQPLNKTTCYCFECILKYIHADEVRKKNLKIFIRYLSTLRCCQQRK